MSGTLCEMPRTVRIVAAVIVRDGKYLLTQRRQDAAQPLFWEFPGGKVEPGESDADALRREVLERVGAEIRVVRPVAFQHHDYDDYAVELVLYEAELQGENVEPLRVKAVEWVHPMNFDRYPFPPADEAARGQVFPSGAPRKGKKEKAKA
jgi:8-oxo-dGTP diphosphatase